jgi:predicted transcriptional regulator
MKEAPEDKAVSVRMDLRALKALEKIGEELDRSVSWMVRKAVDEYITRHNAKEKT